MWRSLRTNWWYFAILIAVGAALRFDSAAQSDSVRNEVIESCERVNVLRTEVNRRVVAYETLRRIQVQFLEDAASARKRSGDLDVAARYSALADEARQVAIHTVPLTDCERQVTSGFDP